MPRIEEFLTFCKIVDLKSFSLAAEVLHISQSAVSQQMKSLEEAYGTRLLHRNGLKVVPTEQGKIVYDYGSRMLTLYEHSHQQVEAQNGTVTGHLQIGSSSGPGETLIPIILGGFKTLFPDVQVALRVGDSREITDAVFNRLLEIAFVGLFRRDRHLIFEPFLHDEIILVAPADHPWASRSSINYQEFLKAPLILQQQGSGATALLREVLAENGIGLNRLNVVMQLGLQESTKVAVRNGYGMTMISHLGVQAELARGELVHIEVENLKLVRDIYTCYNRDEALTPLAQNFLDYAIQNRHPKTKE